MSESWDDYADDWDLNPDVIRYADNAYETLIREIDLAGLNILDFGCGTGSLAKKMAAIAAQVVAIDKSAKMIKVLAAKKINNIEALDLDICKANLKSVPAFRRKFDLVTASSVFSFVADYHATLSIIKKHLAPNGRLVQWDWYSDGTGNGFTTQMIETAYQEAGFSSLKIEKAFDLTSERGTMSVIMAIASPQF